MPTSQQMKLKEVFEKSVQFFKEKNIETARLDAEILLSHALKIDRIQIYMKLDQPLDENEIQTCRDYVRRRSLGEPVAYIVEEKGFFGQDFFVGKGVLIPRPETELMVEEALAFFKKNEKSNPRVLDLGAGSGCIGFSILKNFETATLMSLERSSDAFYYLQKNQEKLSLKNNSEIILTDVLNYKTNETFDLIVANPPYIDKNDLEVEATVKKFEPAEALFADEQGYADILSWVKKYVNHLKPEACFLIEIGHKQAPQLVENIKAHYPQLKIEIKKDLAKKDRLLILKN